MSSNKKVSVQDRKLINKIFWRSLVLEGSFNFQKMQALGFTFTMMPVINKFYSSLEEKKEALKRHTAFFNTTPYVSTFIMGLTASMEKENSQNKDFDPSSINAVKVGLMGPLAGIGDSFFWGTFRVIAAGVGISLAQQGSILGPIIFLLMFNIPHYIIRYFCTIWGFTLGTKFLETAYESNIIQTITKAATIIGLTTVGAMVSSMVKFKTALNIKFGDMEFVLQDVFDQIIPNMLPLLFTLFCYYLIRKGVKVNYILIGILIFGILGKMIGLL